MMMYCFIYLFSILLQVSFHILIINRVQNTTETIHECALLLVYMLIVPSFLFCWNISLRERERAGALLYRESLFYIFPVLINNI